MSLPACCTICRTRNDLLVVEPLTSFNSSVVLSFLQGYFVLR